MNETMIIRGKFDTVIFYKNNSCELIEHEIDTAGMLKVKNVEKFFYPVVDKDGEVKYTTNHN